MKLGLVIILFVSLAYSQQEEVRIKMAELFKIKESIKSRVFERSRKDQEIQRIGIEISKQSEKIQQLKVSTEQLTLNMQNRAMTLYKIKKASPVIGLFSIEKSQDFLRKAYFAQYFHKQDQELSKQLNGLRTQLKQQDLQFKKRISYLSGLKKKSEQDFLTLKQQENQYRQMIQKIKAESFDPVADASQFSSLRGELPLPVQSSFKADFGLKRQRNSDLSFLNTGVYFETKGGEAVLSAFQGQVSFVGVLPHWGTVLILDHGDSYFTVYGNLTDLSVGLGDRVIQQQKLAQVTNKKYDSKNGFYFEIRHFTEPQNPKEWFRQGVIQ